MVALHRGTVLSSVAPGVDRPVAQSRAGVEIHSCGHRRGDGVAGGIADPRRCRAELRVPQL